MTKIKQNKIKKKTEPIKRKAIAKKLNKKWEKVKIKGKVLSDDGGGFEGLIGLEVLENYEPAFVNSGKIKPGTTGKEDKSKPKKRKLDKQEYDEAYNSGTATEDDEQKIAKTKKEKYAERKAKILEKRMERREKRKQKRKLKITESGEQDDSTDADVHAAGRFVLLRPPSASEESEEEIPELVGKDAKAESADFMDKLDGWNGLGVPQPILRAIAENGFVSPTEIQAMTLPAAIMGKKDILGAAETGSGKTLAFGIPILAGIMELRARKASRGIRKAPKIKGQQDKKQPEEDRELTPPPDELSNYPPLPSEDENSDDEEMSKCKARNSPLYALVLTPTRELAVQVRNHITNAAKYTGIQVAAIFGGLSIAKQERILRKCPEIIVATPGRLWELYQESNSHLSKIDDISFLVIDETDRMVEKGHFEELRNLLTVLNADEAKKQTRQNFVFSATLTLVHDLPDHMKNRNTGKRPKFIKQTPGLKIQQLIEELGISQPKIVDITRSQQTAQNLTECRLICSIEQKDFYLYYFLMRHPGRTIVFCNSIDCVKRLATLFGLLDCNPLPLHANMIQKQRLKNLERFRDNADGLLIATDVAARGLDIPNVEHVIHYQVPRTSENYVHRSGRTARANKNGITVMFMEPGEVKNYVKLYKTLDRSEDLPLFPVADRYMNAVKERVNVAREVDKEELKLKRTQTEIGWMKKHAEEMDMIIDGYNDESGSEQDEDPFILERRRNRLHLENVRAKLKNLLSQQIFPKGFSFKYPTSTGHLQVPNISASAQHNSAVKVMKDAIEDMKLAKKMRNKKKNTGT